MATSKHDKQALADLFIHMGVPLITSIQTVESWSGGEAEPQVQRAEKLAKLLNVSVDFATKVTKKLEIRDAYTLENVRGRIIRIVTPIIGDYYVTNGSLPEEDALNSLTDLFDVLISFASSVSPTDEKGSKSSKIALLIEQSAPLIDAIRANNLGQKEPDIFTNSVDGIKTRAEQLAESLGQADGIESGLYKAVLAVFTSSYKQIAEKEGTLDDVWNECDQRLILIQGLTAFVGDKAGIDKGEKTKAQTPAKTKEEKEPEKKETSPSEESKKSNDNNGDSDDSDDDADDGDFNPMAFFSGG